METITIGPEKIAVVIVRCWLGEKLPGKDDYVKCVSKIGKAIDWTIKHEEYQHVDVEYWSHECEYRLMGTLKFKRNSIERHPFYCPKF